MRTQRAREFKPQLLPSHTGLLKLLSGADPIGWNRLPWCPVPASECHLSLVCLQISTEMLLQTKWIGHSPSTCHFENSLGDPLVYFVGTPGWGAPQWPHWDKQYWGWLSGLFTWKFTSGGGGMFCRCTEEHCITKNHSKYFGGPKHLYISPGNLPSSLPAWKEFYSSRLEPKLQWFKRELATVGTIMPYIVRMQLASQPPCSSLKMCLLFNYLQGKMQRQLKSQEIKMIVKGWEGFVKWFIRSAYKIIACSPLLNDEEILCRNSAHYETHPAHTKTVFTMPYIN